MNSEPMSIQKSQTMYDNHGRPLNYLRLSVTDRCNLRCTYCMPEEGINYLPRNEILSYEEMERLIRLLARMGVTKVRITGGEPFVRKGLMDFLRRINANQGIEEIHITTNGVLTEQHVPELNHIGIAGINLSLDTMDRKHFIDITRRDEFDRVMATFHKILEYNIPLKVNAVVMGSMNSDQIVPLAKLTKEFAIEMRYIEEMPFNGQTNEIPNLRWNARQILHELNQSFAGMRQLPDKPSSTSMIYEIPGHKGNVGIIAGFSRLFCATCNRLRITAKGMLKTCLYDDGVLDLKEMVRAGLSDEAIQNAILECVGNRFKDGFEAQRSTTRQGAVSESMSEIGG